MLFFCLFFFTDAAPTEIYTLSYTTLFRSVGIHHGARLADVAHARASPKDEDVHHVLDRKSTRLNSSHITISYAVFCLKKKTHPELSTYHDPLDDHSFLLARPDDRRRVYEL